MLRYLMLSCFTAVFSAGVVAQDLHTWRSKSGHFTKAAFHSIDATSKTVTLLVPKQVSFEDLDKQSLELAHSLGNEPTPATKYPKHEAGIRFIEVKLQELLSFKENPQFIEFGFSRGGPYSEWMKEVGHAHKTEKFQSKGTLFAITHLQTLGLEYVRSKGKETDYSGSARQKIQWVLDGKSWKSAPFRGDELLDSNRTKLTNPRPGVEKWIDGDYADQLGGIYGFDDIDKVTRYVTGKTPAILSASQRQALGVTVLSVPQKVEIKAVHGIGNMRVYEIALQSDQTETYFVENVYDTK